jgi:transcriptional regulator GlxA family with amidase domain
MYEFDFDATLGGVNWYERLGRKALHPVVDVPDKERMSALFETSLRHEMGKDPTFELIARTNLAEIIGTFASLSFEREEKEAPFKEVTDYMEAHLEGQVKVDTLAEIACMQTTYFIKKFGEAFGTSPINYLNKLRIYRAMTRLASTDDTIDNISKSCGFFDNSYFSRVFRGFVGTTPREYREIFK